MNLLSLFSGIGGIDRAANMFGIKTVAFVECDPFCQAILKLRFPGVPVYGDIRGVTAKQLKHDGITSIDIVAGGFPCQGNSTAGKRKGKADERYLWPEMARVVREVESPWMVAENVRGILSVDGGELFGDVLRDVANMGHSAGWGCWGACDVGAPHQRNRVFIMAHSKGKRCGEARYDWRRSKEWTTGSGLVPCGLMWPTPRANSFKAAAVHGECGLDIQTAVKLWPTPRAGKIGGYSSPGYSPVLEQAVNMWPTPTTRDYKSGTGSKVRAGHAPPLSDVCQGQLNPEWVECLMNFPIGWTDPECKEPSQWPGWPAYRDQEQFCYEPPRVVSGVKHRAKRLKALGNAVLPLHAAPIFAAIREIEAGA